MGTGMETEITENIEDRSTKVTDTVTSTLVITPHNNDTTDQLEEHNENTPVTSKHTFQANENIKTQSENTETTISLTDGETNKISGETFPEITQSTNERTTVRITQDMASLETLGSGTLGNSKSKTTNSNENYSKSEEIKISEDFTISNEKVNTL